VTPDWTATQEPFSKAVGEQYMAELTRKKLRCPMNERAWKSEVMDFAKVALQVYLKQKGN
jgi:hypothetical protein